MLVYRNKLDHAITYCIWYFFNILGAASVQGAGPDSMLRIGGSGPLACLGLRQTGSAPCFAPSFPAV